MTIFRITFATIVFIGMVSLLQAVESRNLLPNGEFKGDDPMTGWLIDFPNEGFYKDNAAYIKISSANPSNGHAAVMIELPAGIAGNQGGKLESVPIPVLPGGRYRIELDCMTWDFSAKIHAEAWTTDPHPQQKRTIFRRARADGRPPLMMCYRAQVPSPPSNSKIWTTIGRDFSIPESVVIDGKPQKPEYLSIKVVAYEATMAAGKSYFSHFRLFQIKPQSSENNSRDTP